MRVEEIDEGLKVEDGGWLIVKNLDNLHIKALEASCIYYNSDAIISSYSPRVRA